MHFTKTKTLCFIFICLLTISNSKVQAQKDTIYFDEGWSICEKPVAEYYRVTKLQRESVISYSDSTTDFYINGMPLMTGRYIDGQKQGEFIFYRKNGKITKRGYYQNDEMKGIWYYYDSTGILKAEFDCYNSLDFIPILIINNSGDTIVKSGDGKFIFNVKNDLPEIFHPSCTFTIQGEIKSGKIDGLLIFSDTLDGKIIKFTKIYKNGEFQRNKSESNSLIASNVLIPKSLFFYLIDPWLASVDDFKHTNMVFGFGEEGDQKVINFLANNEIPEIKSQSNSVENDINDFYNIIGHVIRKYTDVKGAKNVSYSYPPVKGVNNLLSFSITSTNRKELIKIKCNSIITIDTSGYVVNSTFTGNLPKKEIDEINYYLSRLSGLKSNEQNGQKVFSNISINISTFIDTVKKNNEINSIYYKCRAVNGDTPDADFILNQRDSVTNKVQIEAKFPGGAVVWQKYLERNLNSNVLVEHNAPNGIYTVIVSFLVDKEGKISEVQALNNPGYGSVEEAVRVLKKGPDWTPAVQDGKNVIYRQKQSFTFEVSGQ